MNIHSLAPFVDASESIEQFILQGTALLAKTLQIDAYQKIQILLELGGFRPRIRHLE